MAALLVPWWWRQGYLLPPLNAIPLSITVGEGPNRFQEPVELLLGAAFVLFVAEAWMLSRAEAAEPTAGAAHHPADRGLVLRR